MASNKSAVLRIKNNAGNYLALNPKTTKDQVIAWDVGDIQGPYILTVKADQWVRNKQYIDLAGVGSNDILECVPVYEGTKEQMIAQKKAYGKLMLIGGIQSLANQVMFVYDSETPPDVDFKVQVWWTK